MSKLLALVYCRVSSDRQLAEGQGLESQEHRCRAFALTKGYEVEKVFRDSFTGGGDFMQRPDMKALIEHVDSNPHRRYVLIFDDLKRFARDTVNHIRLRQALDARGVSVECPNFTFEDTPEGEFIEIILAAQGELERKQNRRQVIQKQKARLENGYWPFFPPPGYKSAKLPPHGKLLVWDEPKASIIKEALEGFATGRFQEQVDVQKFLQDKGFYAGKGRGIVYLEQVKRLLTRIMYAGYIEYPNWEVSRRKGHHEPLVSLETYELIQERLAGRVKVRIRKDSHEDFPLRGFVLCSHCREPFTASWSKGRNAKFPYYRCRNPRCEMHNKSVRKEIIEAHFEAILRKIKPKENTLDLTKALFLKRWSIKVGESKEAQLRMEKELSELQDDMTRLTLRASKVQSEKTARIYEAQVDELSEKEALLQENIVAIQTPFVDFETALDEVFELLKAPYFYWRNGGLVDKRLVLRLAFAERIAYDRENGFETAKLSLPLRVFELSESDNSHLVEMAGIEPASNKEV